MPFIGDLWADEDEAAEIWAAVAEADAEDAEAAQSEELASWAQDQELARLQHEAYQQEEAYEQDGAPRGSSENRLQRALQRIQAGTYVPPPGIPDADRDSWRQPGRVAGMGSNCGPSHPVNGACMNTSHQALCSSLSTSEISEALAASGEYGRRAWLPVTDATGELVMTQDGRGATWGDVIAADFGQRTRSGGQFEADRQAQRGELPELHVRGFGYPADAALLARAREALGVVPQPTARQRGLEQLTARTASQLLGWRSGTRPHPDYGESPQERRERMHAPVRLRASQADPDGTVSGYAAG